MSEEKKTKKIKIELKEDIAQGHYVNLPIIGYSQAEFILDFIKMFIPHMSKKELSIFLAKRHSK